MTNRTPSARYRLLAFLQITLILGWLLSPVAGLAADPGQAPDASASADPAGTPSSAPNEPAEPSSPEPPSLEPSSPEPSPATPSAAPSPAPTAATIESSGPADPPESEAPSPPSAPPASPAPTASPATDDYVVTFAPGTGASARASILAAAGAEVVDTIAPLRMAVVRVPEGSTVVNLLRADPDVLRVDLDRVRSAEAAPDDPAYPSQWSLPLIGWDTVRASAHPSGRSVVAVLDTGVDATHPDLAGRLVSGTSLLPGSDPTVDPNGHGTAMAGIIAAAADNGQGIAGIGFAGVKVMPVTVLDANGLGQDSDIIEGVVWAVDHGANVINLSFSNPGFSAALQSAIDYAWTHDVVVVAATGNDGSSAPTYPAGDRGVIGVSNTNEADQLDGSSNHGADTFLGAPGTGIVTLQPGGGTTSISGTSASSAEVAGAAALLRALDPGASNGVIVGRLARSAAPVGTRSETGNGRLDLAQAAADDGSDPLKPAGAAPTGPGGPFVGPYVAAAVTWIGGTNGKSGPATTSPGAGFSYTLRVTGNGNQGNITITDAVPGPLTVGIVSGVGSSGASSCAATVGNNVSCTLTGPANNATYTVTIPVTVPGGATDGTVYSNTAAATCTGNCGGASVTSNQVNTTVDSVAPTVTINQAAAQVDPARTSPINFTVTFSENAVGFATGDVTIGGTSGGVKTGTVTGGPAVFNVAVTGMTTPGTVVASLGAGVATDAGGNPNAASTSTDNTVTWDNVAPTVTINQAVGQADPTNTSPINYTVTFSEPVTGFATGDVTIGGTSGGVKTGTVTGGPTVYTVAVTGMTTSGTVTATIAASVATDLAGNNNAASTSADNTVTWDVVAPTVTINQAAAQVDPTGTSPINFTVTFSEAVVGFATGDVTIGGTSGGVKTGTVTGGPTVFNVAVTGMTTPGTVIASLGAGVATDPAGNNNAASTSVDNTVTWDNVAPTVTINQAAAQPDPTNTSPINYTVTFSEPVIGFATGDVTFAGTAGGGKTGTVTGGPTVFNVAVTGMTTSGTVIATIAAARATDLAGNNNVASTSTDNTVTWDNVAPTVTINQAVGQADPTNTSPINYTVTFSEPVTGFATGDVTIGGTSGGVKTGTVTGGPTVYTVAVTGMTTSGTVTATIAASVATDLAGNNNAASTSADNTVTWDVVAPTVTINQAAAQVDPTGTSPINFTVTFSEAVVGFATGDVTIGGTSGGVKTGTVTGGPTVFNVAVTGMTTPGTVIASLGAGVATDPAGNNNAASTSVDNTVTWDNVAPTVTINQAAAQPDPTNTSPINYTVTFSEPVIGFATGDVTFAGTAGGGKTGTVTGGPTVFNVAVTGMTTSGTVIATIAAARATDLAGNNNVASTSTDNTVTWDNVAPTVTINQAVGQADPTNTSPINYTVTFSEPVTGFATGDVTIGGTSGGVKTGTVTGGPTVYTVAVTGMTTSGTVTATIAASVATDLAGNNNAASTSADNTVTWDVVAPTVTINQAAAQVDPTGTSPINFTVTFSEAVVGFATGDVTIGGTSGGVKTGTVTGGPTVFNVAVTGMTTPGTVIASLGAGVATDPAGNNNAASTSVDNTVTWDNVAPTAVIDLQAGSDTGASNSDDITNAATLVFDVTWSESVAGFLANDLSNVGTAAGCVIGAPAGAAAAYTVTLTGCGAGTVILRIRVNAVTDAAGNNNAQTDGPTVTIDRTAPTVTINQAIGQADPTNTSPINYTVTFSEPVTGFATGDVTIGGTSGGVKTGTVTGGPTVYTVAVTGMTISGTVIASIGAGVATDLAGNPNTVSTSADNTVTWDNVAPTVTINQAAAQPDPTNASPINFTVVFSEPVIGFATGDVSFTGSTVGGALTGTVTGGPTTYNVAVTGMTTPGTVVASLGASVATDPAGNNNAASTSADNTVTWDNVAPTVTINQAAAQPDPTNASPINFTVVFSEPVIGFATGDVTLGGTAGGVLVGTVTGGPTTYNVAVTGMTTSGTVIASMAANRATDAAGNNNVASTSVDNTVTWDVVAPTVAINQAIGQADPTNASPINFTVTFSEPVTGFATGDVTIGGTSGGVKTGTVTGGPTTFNVAVTGMTTSGTVIASIGAGVATDLAGNPNTVSTSADNTVTWNRATHLAFQQGPTNTVYRSTMSPAVTVAILDDNGLVVTESSASVTLALTPAGPTLGGTLTVAAVNGIATFGNLAVDQVGTYQLQSSSAGLIGATSASFDVTPAPLTITADDRTKTYGQTVVFAGTEFTTSGLLGTDTVTSVTLASAGAAPTATVAGSPYPITPSAALGTGLGNYTISYVPGALTVNPAPLTITANDRTKTYGQTVVFAGTEFTTSGLLNTDTVTSVSLASPGAIATATVAGSPYPITISAAVGTGLGNYTIGYVPGTLTVDPAVAVIVVTGYSVTYDALPHTATGTATGVLGEDLSAGLDLSATTRTAVGTTVDPWTFSDPAGNYLADAGTVIDEIDPAPLTITADDRTKTYGQTVVFAGTEFTTSGLLGTDTVTSVTLASAGAAPTATVAGSPYPITPSAALGTGLGNYTISYVPGALTVNPAPLTITANDRTKTYGQTVVFAGTEFTTSGLLNTDTVTSVSLASPGAIATATVAGSPYPITISAAVGTGLGNYTIGYVPGTLTVDPAVAVIVVTGYSVTYDALPHTATGTATGVLGEDLSAGLDLSATTRTAVGTTVDPWTFSDPAGNYLADAGTVIDEIDPAPLTITADDRTKTYGQTVVFAGTEFTTSGLLGTDTVTSVTLASAGAAPTATVAGSPYPITPSAALGTGLGNYTISYVPGALTVNPAPLTITANDRTKTYGQTVVFAGTEFTTSGLLNTDTVTSVSLASPGAIATATVAGSPYPITISAAVGTGLGNYTIGYVPGTLTVDPAVAVIVVTGYSVTYDALPHTATGTATGVLGEDLSAGLDLSATTRTAVGTTVDPWTFSDPAGNYLADAGTVIDEIDPAPLTITADDRTKTYGQTVVFAGTEFTTSGLLGTDTVTSVTLASAGAAPTATVAGSPYPITPSAALGTGLGNYTISYVPGALTVNPAPLTITANDQSKPFGILFVFDGTEFSVAGLHNADSVAAAILASAGAPALAAPGTYPITISAAVGTGLANYTITYVPGTFTVGNTPPIVGDAAVETDATVPVSGAVTVTDPDTGQTVTLTVSTAPAHGTVSIAQDGSFTYTPTGTFTGQDGFTIEGCDDNAIPACAMGTVNVAVFPVAVDDADVTSAGQTVEVDVEANDIGDAGTPQIVVGPAHGTATIGSIIYTPAAGFSGLDQVTYRICSPNDPALCDDATLTITVNAAIPQTDADPILGTPFGPVRATTAWAVILTLVLISGFGAAVIIRRRPGDR